MNIEELKSAVKREGHISLVIPREPTGVRIRLTPKAGPLGHVLNVQRGTTVALFSCKAIRRFLEKNNI